MAQTSFPEGHGSIFVKTPKNELTRGVEDPGDQYMAAAHAALVEICKVLADRGGMPHVEDVAHHLKELLPGGQKLLTEEEVEAMIAFADEGDKPGGTTAWGVKFDKVMYAAGAVRSRQKP